MTYLCKSKYEFCFTKITQPTIDYLIAYYTKWEGLIFNTPRTFPEILSLIHWWILGFMTAFSG